MKIVTKLLAITLTVAALGGCKKTELGGPVVNADIFIDLLNQPGAGFQDSHTTDRVDVVRDLGLEKANSIGHANMFLRLGNFQVDAELIDKPALYFVTARYGKDVDADRDLIPDTKPVEVEGEWHAIMDGAALVANGCFVSALTEAAYQYVRDQIGFVSDSELVALLDEFARKVVADVNGDGLVDYSDVLNWSRRLSKDKYLGDIAFLDKLADVIIAGELDHVVRAAAESVWLNRLIGPDPPNQAADTGIGGNVSEDVVLTLDKSPYRLDTTMTINGDLRIEPGVRLRGHGRRLTVNGDLQIQGYPRNPAIIEDLSIAVNTYQETPGTWMENVVMDNCSLLATLRHLTVESSRLDFSQLEIRGSANTAGSGAVMRQNILEDSRVTFYNPAPVQESFTIDFSNNLFIPTDNTDSRLTSKWEGAVENLVIINNSFHPNMRILRFDFAAVMNVVDNYWGVESIEDIDMGMVIPGRSSDEFDEPIHYVPRLIAPHPDTPVVP